MASKNHIGRTGQESHERMLHPVIRTQEALFDWIKSFAEQSGPAVVLALSESAHVAASQVAGKDSRLECSLLLVRAFSSPQNPEIELGAVIENGEIYLSRGASHLGIREIDVEAASLNAIRELHDLRREKSQLPRFQANDVPILVVDDGSATLVALLASIRFLNNLSLRDITLALPQSFTSFVECLDSAGAKLVQFDSGILSSTPLSNSKAVRIPCGRSVIKGEIEISENPLEGIIICGNGFSDGRLKRAAHQFHAAGFSVLSFDLLDESEISEADDEYLTPLLAHRLSLVVEWISTQKDLRTRPIGLFGIGFASSASLQVAAQYPKKISAVVAHSMRPELSQAYLRLVRAPTLFLSQSTDDLSAGDRALKADVCFSELACEKLKLEIDDLDENLTVGATGWFKRYTIETSHTERPPKLPSEASHQTN